MMPEHKSAEAENNFQRTERALKTISACNGVLVRAKSETVLLLEICRVIVELGGYRLAWVGFAQNDEAESVGIAARAGQDDGYLEQSRLSWSEDSERGCGLTGAAIRTGEIFVCNDFQTDLHAAPWREAAARHGFASSLALPLRHAEKNFGVLSIYSAETHAFSLTEVELLHELAEDMGYGIQALRARFEHQQAEENLRESEKKFSGIFHSSAVPISLSTVQEGRYLDANPAFLKMLERSREEVVGHTSLEINLWPDPRQRAAAVARLEDHEPVRNIELDIRTKSGELRQILWSAAELDIGGERCWLGSSLDITEQKRAAELLRQERELYLDLVNNQPAGIYRVRVIPKDQHRQDAWSNSEHAPYCFELASDRFCEILGVQRAVFTTNPGIFIDLIHPEDKAGFARQNEEASRSLRPFRWEGRLVIAGKITWVHVESLPRPAANGEMIWTGILYDITEQKQAEDQMRLQSAALTAAANGIVITDRAGKIEWVNPSFTQLTGYSAGEAIGQNPRMLKSGEHPPAHYANLWTTISAGNVWHGEMINKRKDGRLYTEEMTITPVRGSAGEITHFVVIKQDVTERQLLESQLRQSQKMEAIGQLAGGVAHDFNNILCAMLMQAALIERIEPLPQAATEGLKQIRVFADRAAELTRQLLLFSRRQVMQPRLLNLNEVVTNLVKMLQRIIGEDVRLQLDLHAAPLILSADPGMVEQVLMNLTVNARDAMPKGGRLRIETAEETVTESSAGRHPDAVPGRYVCFGVSDTGGGVPPEILPKIFEPFFTTKEAGKGTGLGLATVFGIVKQHQGWIKVDNHPGRGVAFWIFLPASTETAAETSHSFDQPQPRGGSETILLVEDESSVRKLIHALLTRHGYQVLAAANGVEALSLWEADRDAVALLVTDLVMPAGLSGQDLARQLQAVRPNLKVIFISGYSAEIAGRELQLHGGENFVQKPFAADHLLETVRRCLDG